MKKILMTALSCFVLLIASQTASHAQFNLSAGYESSFYKLDGEKQGNSFDGFTAEVGYTARFLDRLLGINFGAAYTFSTRNNGKSVLGTSSTQEQILTVPLRFIIAIPVQRFSIMLGAGGYASYHLSGIDSYVTDIKPSTMEGESLIIHYDYLRNTISTNMDSPQSILDEIRGQLGESSFNRHDAGMQFGAGFGLWDSVMFNVSWSRSLLNRYTDSAKGDMRRQTLAARISFLF